MNKCSVVLTGERFISPLVHKRCGSLATNLSPVAVFAEMPR